MFLSKNASSYDKMHRVLIVSIFEVNYFRSLKFEKMSTNSWLMIETKFQSLISQLFVDIFSNFKILKLSTFSQLQFCILWVLTADEQILTHRDLKVFYGAKIGKWYQWYLRYTTAVRPKNYTKVNHPYRWYEKGIWL